MKLTQKSVVRGPWSVVFSAITIRSLAAARSPLLLTTRCGLLTILVSAFCILHSAFPASAQTYTATLTVTNLTPTTNGTGFLMIATGGSPGRLMQWSNATPATLLLKPLLIPSTNTMPNAAANLFTKLTNSFGASLFYTFSSPTGIVLRTPSGTALSVIVSNAWASVSYSTNWIQTNYTGSIDVSNVNANSIKLNGTNITTFFGGSGGSSTNYTFVQTNAGPLVGTNGILVFINTNTVAFASDLLPVAISATNSANAIGTNWIRCYNSGGTVLDGLFYHWSGVGSYTNAFGNAADYFTNVGGLWGYKNVFLSQNAVSNTIVGHYTGGPISPIDVAFALDGANIPVQSSQFVGTAGSNNMVSAWTAAVSASSNLYQRKFTNLLFNVMDYGAIPNDGQDDTVAFMSCASNVNALGGTFYMPSGAFNVTNQITFTGPADGLVTSGSRGNIEIAGNGETTIVAEVGGPTNCVFWLTYPRSMWVHDFKITAEGTATTNIAGIVLFGPLGTAFNMERVTLNRMREGALANDISDVSIDVVGWGNFVTIATATSCDHWKLKFRSENGAYGALFGYTNAIFNSGNTASITNTGVNCDAMDVEYDGDRSYPTNSTWPESQIWIRAPGVYTLHNCYTEANHSDPLLPVIMVGELAGGMKFAGGVTLNMERNEHLSHTAGNTWLYAPANVRVKGASGWDGTRYHDSVVFKNATAMTSTYHSDHSGMLVYTNGSVQIGACDYNASGTYMGLGDAFNATKGILSSLGGTPATGEILEAVGWTGTDTVLGRTNLQKGWVFWWTNGVPTLQTVGTAVFAGNGNGLTNVNASSLGGNPAANFLSNNFAGSVSVFGTLAVTAIASTTLATPTFTGIASATNLSIGQISITGGSETGISNLVTTNLTAQNATLNGVLNNNATTTNTASMVFNAGSHIVFNTNISDTTVISYGSGTSGFRGGYQSGFGIFRLLRIDATPALDVNVSGGSSRSYADFFKSDGGFVAGTTIAATNGFISVSSNTLAPIAITFPATTANWTNTTGRNIFVFIDNTAVTGTSVKMNGTTIFSGLSTDVTLPLQNNEFFSETYTVGTPTATIKPF